MPLNPDTIARPRSSKLRHLAYVCQWMVVRRNLLIALIVGCTLSAANQYDAIAHGHFTFILALKLLVNFLVPFVVSSVSAAVNRTGGSRRPADPVDSSTMRTS